jgi:hypothetical protein
MQALGLGVPLLVSDNEFHSPEIEACKAGKTCLFFKAGCKESLSQGLQTFYEKRDDWATKREGISKWIADTYSFERMAQAYASMVRQVLTLHHSAKS